MKVLFKKIALGFAIPSVLLLGACGSGGGETKTNSESPSSDSGIQKRNIKAGAVLQEDHSTGQGLKKFAELVDEKSDGKMTVTPYFSGTLGDEQKMVEATQAGLQEVVISTTPVIQTNVKEFAILDLPFAFDTVEEGAAVMDGAIGQKLMEKLPEHQLVGLAFWENGMRSLTNSKHPVTTAEDFKGLKIRTQQNTAHIDSFKALGANPIPMPYTEVFTAMETKTIDGAENAIPVFASDKFNEVQEYLSLTEHLYSTFAVMVSKKFWDGLSPEEQEIMKEAAIEAREFQRETNRADVEEATKLLMDAGMKLNEVSPEEREKMREIVKPIHESVAKEIGQDLVNQMNEEISKVRGQ